MKQSRLSNKLIIAGGGANIHLIPYDGFEVWGINDHAFNLKRVDVIFDIHNEDTINSNYRTKNYIEKLKDFEGTVYMQKKQKDIPSSVKFPIEEIKERYGEFFFGTFDYMMALAIEMGYEEIHLYGIDLAIQGEYAYQRPSAMYYIGLARGLGIKVTIPEGSGLNTKGLYAYERNTADEYAETLQEIYQLKTQLNEIEGNIAFNDGLITGIKNLKANKKLNLDGVLQRAIDSRFKVIALKSRVKDKLQEALSRLSDLTGNEVIIPENEVVIKN